MAGRGCAYKKARGLGEIALPFSQFCCESKIALKKKVIIFFLVDLSHYILEWFIRQKNCLII